MESTLAASRFATGRQFMNRPPALTRCVLLGAWLLIMALPAAADDTSDVEAVTARWIDAFNRKSARDIVALYATDAVLFGTSSPVLRDNPELVRDYFKDIAALGNATISVGEHRVQLFGNVAINTGFYTRISRQDGKTVRNPARFSFVYEKRGGQWLIVNHHSSALPQP
jgi:uncharacterized protein (TIGR02246 family)